MNGGSGGYTEHQVKRVVAGEPDTLRRRLCDVLEKFGYTVSSENPIQAKRAQQKGLLQADILEYEIKLAVFLKPVSVASTVATFEYGVPYLFTDGDRLALDREAEAVIALANTVNSTVCPSCGSHSTDAARFCRSCGAPVATPSLAVLEVMRFTAGVSAAQQELWMGLIATVLTLAVALPLILAGRSTAGWVLLSIGALLASFLLQQGMRRLHRTLRQGVPASQPEKGFASLVSTQERTALPPQPMSVTEGTTKLVDSVGPRAATLVKDTDPVE
jgi:hypothetical protein